jgi:molecular chaperone DnaJ
MVQEDPVFQRDGDDIHVEVPITVSQACLGGTVSVPTLTGEVEVKVAAGTQPSEKRVLRGKGIKRVASTQTGNQYIHFRVVVPSTLTPKQKELLEEFSKEEKLPQGKGFFGKIRDYMKKS